MACPGAVQLTVCVAVQGSRVTVLVDPSNCCLIDHATSRLQWSDDDTKGKERAGSVGCHDVTNTCSTKSVMQLLQQSVPENCVSASLRLSRLVSSRLRRRRRLLPHTL